MATDTNREADGEEERSSSRSLTPGEWVTTPRFRHGSVLVFLGLVVVLWVLVVPKAPDQESSAPNEVLWTLTEGQLLFVAVVAVGLGVAVALSGYRLTTRQRQYLDQAERRRLEIRDYLAVLDDVSLEGSESSWEIRSRMRRARTNLEKARRAVYRGDYANFLSLYYEASRQEILLYEFLDDRADGWTFGLGIDPEPEVDETSESSRVRNLSRRIRSYSKTLPEDRQQLVETYLGEPDDSPPPLDLYYAVRELHEWNVSRYERATQIRRFLQGGILVMAVFLVGLIVVLNRGFGGTFLEATSSDATVGTVLLNDWFLGLVVLVGALGAVFSMVYRSFGEFYALTTDPSVPQPVFMLEALLARTLFGSVSALFLFLVARTEFATVVFAEGLLGSPLALLVVGFVAGFSERFVKEAVEKIADEAEASGEDASDEGTGGSAGENGGEDGSGNEPTEEESSDEGGRVTRGGDVEGDDDSESGGRSAGSS